MKAQKTNIAALLALTGCLLAIVSVLLARTMDANDQLALLVDVRHEIVERYVDEANQEKLIESAVNAMVDSLDDQYTSYLSPEDLDEFDQQVLGQFTGIGVEYTIDSTLNRLRIVTPLEDSPAWRAGVMAGDIVLEIEGESTEGIKDREVREKLLGEENTTVQIKVRHESGQEQDIVITRALISVKSVRGFRRDENNQWIYLIDPIHGIGYVKIRQFNDRTVDELRQALDKLSQQSARGLIIDLRYNPGGLLESATAVADMFLKGGQTIVSTKGRKVRELVTKSRDEGTFDNVPIVVLANEHSASGAEIVAGALTDNNRAKFVGMRTFGKGSVQQVIGLQSGHGALKITTAYYYLPNGRLIHRREDSEVWGVDPEDGFFIPMTSEQLKNMFDIERTNQALRNHTDSITPDWIEEHMGDLQLVAALRALLGRIETGHWNAVGQSGAKVLADQRQREQLKQQRNLLLDHLGKIDLELATLNEAYLDRTTEETIHTVKPEPAGAAP